MSRKIFLVCGVLSSVLYVAIDLVAAIAHPEYHAFRSQMISELMARGAPTERLVDPLFLLYDGLVMAFAVGVFTSDDRARTKWAGGLLFAYGAVGLLGPTVFETNMRGSPPASEDLAHIAATVAVVALTLASMVLGASMLGRRFRLFTGAAGTVIVVFGALSSLAAAPLTTNGPTPWVGVTERICIGASLLWIAGLAVALLLRGAPEPLGRPPPLRGAAGLG
jgi:hypothetical protein